MGRESFIAISSLLSRATTPLEDLPKSAAQTRTPSSMRLGKTILLACLGVLLAVGLIAERVFYRLRQRDKLGKKDTIVLADFANSTGDPIFDDTLKTALSISLGQSPFLNPLSYSDIANTLQQMTLPPNTLSSATM